MKIAFLYILLLIFNMEVSMASEGLKTAYDFSFTKGDESKLELSEFKGKVILIVNVASKCGFTSQYKALEEIYTKYKDRGLVVIAVPSNDFGNQEPGEYCEIKNLAEQKFNISFEIVKKEHVIGSEAHPFFSWIRDIMPFYAVPKWNFYKYLIDKNGQIVEWFFSSTEPNAEAIVQKIEKFL